MNIKELAEQAGICESITNKGVWIAHTEDLERFAELVAAAEREACAKLCEPQEAHDDPLTAYNIAQLIRARGDKHEAT